MGFFSRQEDRVFAVVNSKKLSHCQKRDAISRLLIETHIVGALEECMEQDSGYDREAATGMSLYDELHENADRLEPLLKKVGIASERGPVESLVCEKTSLSPEELGALLKQAGVNANAN